MKRDYWPTEQWRSIDPQSVSIDISILNRMEIEHNSHHDNLLGLLIVRKGFIIWEKYYHDCTPNKACNVASVTKSVTSALIGIAIQCGYIHSVNDKVLDFFPEYDAGKDARLKREVTIQNLLTMTAPYPFPNFREPLDRLRRQPDWVRFSLDMLGQGGMPGQFKYSTSGTHLLSAILSRTTGQSARAFANEHLFHPIGMHEIPHFEKQLFGFTDIFGPGVKGWLHDPQGITCGGFGLTLSLQDMARFGFLYLNNGLWEGKQVVPKTWIEESIARNENGYGYLWWLRNDDPFAYMAMGDGGNTICCVPEKDLLVVIISTTTGKSRDRWGLIKKFILSAIKD